MKAPLPYRIIFDSKGIISVYRLLGKESFSAFLLDLMYINTNSLHHKKNHIITSKISHEILSQHLIDNNEPLPTYLSAAIRPQENSDLEAITDEPERIWEYAILVSGEVPYKTTIFTDKSSKTAYSPYKEKDGKENITILDEQSARGIITDLKNFCYGCKR